MKKFSSAITAVSLAATMCIGTAYAVRPGGVSYSDEGGKSIAAVRNGINNIFLEVTNTSDTAKSVQLITAVYDDVTDSLCKAVYSSAEMLESGDNTILTSQLDLNTADGYTVKNYIWDSLDGSLMPYSAYQSGIIVADAEYRAIGNALITWTQIDDTKPASYSVWKNGSLLKSSLDGDASVYIDENPEHGDFYSVCAHNASGDIISSSNSVSLIVENPEKPEFSYTESDEIYKYVAADNADCSGNSNTDYSYSSEDKQIGVQRNSKTLNAADKTATIPADAAWTLVEAGPEGDKRTALYTTTYTSSAGASKNGNILVNLGSNYTTEDASQSVTVTYYDHLSSGGFRIRYITSTGHAPVGVNYTGTGRWLTKTITLPNAYFNGTSVVLGGNADFRFESNGNDLYISEFSVNNGTLAAISPNRYDTFTVDRSSVISTNSSGWSIRGCGTGIMAEGQETLVDDGDGTYSTASSQDTTYMYVSEIDGRSALMTTPYTRPNGNEAKGFISFRLDNYKFLPEDREVVIDVVYNSKYGTPIINYMNSYNTETSALTAATATSPEIIGTDIWKTARFTINSMYMNYYVNGDCNLFGGTTDASFRVRADSKVYINSVTVMTKSYFDNIVSSYDSALQEYEELTTNLTPDADVLYPDGISINFAEGAQVNGGLVFNDAISDDTTPNDGNFRYTEDGNAVMTQSYTGGNYTDTRKRLTYLYFDIDKAYLRGIYDNYAEITVEYLDESTYTMQLQYFNSDDAVVTKNHAHTGTGQWKTHTFIVDDLYCMKDKFGGGYDIRFALNCAQPTEENPDPVQLKVKSVKVKNLSHKKQNYARYSDVPKVFIASDSIAAKYTDGSRPYGERYGWGEKLDPGVSVVNYARAGASTKTFEYFDTIANSLNKNDYVLICFGHNDSMSNKYVSPEQYKANIRVFADKIMNVQAIPVIMSPIPTLYNGETDLASEGGINNYRRAAEEIASELNVPFFDLATAFGNVLDSCETVVEKEAYYVPDNETSARYVHLSETGAQCIADLVENALADNSMIRTLKQYIH